MSIIYDALRPQSTGTALPPAKSKLSLWSQLSTRYRNTALALCGFALTVPLALWLASPKQAPAAATLPTAETAAATAPATVVPTQAATTQSKQDVVMPIAPPAMADARPLPASPAPSVPAVAQTTTDVALNTPPPPAAPAPMPATAAPASAPASTVGLQNSGINIQVKQRGTQDAAGAADTGQNDQAVQKGIARVEQAMAQGNIPAARTALNQLESALSPGSLTLLRMQAWVAHGSNDMQTAETLYRKVLERVPDDINAGVNVAILDARRGDVADARDRLQRLSGLYPRSNEISRALSELDARSQ